MAEAPSPSSSRSRRWSSGVASAIGFVGGFNVFLLTGFVLTGFFGFALLDRLGMHPLASFFGGYVLAFNPWMFERANYGHAAFTHVWIFLALILALLRMSERRTIASAALAGLASGARSCSRPTSVCSGRSSSACTSCSSRPRTRAAGEAADIRAGLQRARGDTALPPPGIDRLQARPGETSRA